MPRFRLANSTLTHERNHVYSSEKPSFYDTFMCEDTRQTFAPNAGFQVAMISGFSTRPYKLRQLEKALAQRDLRRVRELSPLGAYPITLAERLGNNIPVHVIWQPAETRGDLLPLYKTEDLSEVRNTLKEASKNGHPLFLISDSYGARALLHYLAKEGPKLNVLGAILINPMNSTHEALESYKILRPTIERTYRLLGKIPLLENIPLLRHIRIPGYNMGSRPYLHANPGEKLRGRQKPRAWFDARTARTMMNFNLRKDFPRESLNDVPLTLIDSEKDMLTNLEPLTSSLKAKKIPLANAGHAPYTNEFLSERLTLLTTEEIKDMLKMSQASYKPPA